MGIINLPNGVGGSTGATLATAAPILLNSGTNSNVWYVDDSGTDGASPAGLNRSDPLATLEQAITNAETSIQAGEGPQFIVLLDGHAETVTSKMTIAENIVLIGEGSASGVPTVTITNNQAAGVLLEVTTAHFEMYNIKFAAQSQACSAVKVDLNGGTTAVIDGCYFEADGNDDAANLDIASTYCELRNCTFISTSTDDTAQPAAAVTATGTVTKLTMNGVALSNGTVGYSTAYAMDLTGGTITQLTSIGQSLLLGASMKVLEATEGYINIQTSTGGPSRVDWADVT